ncbi:hypothetical protein DRE_00232 [Drechslerella stenobrocha 248]|uniref:Uncharacterized protein n=1 Tax=Drechslerella stenobrocha 248 TaxID=1043628 RepID=W7I9Y4_9PEZI|nr:hypothetical protein DRE_00232 [Drechslerella stenobrocha 248]
MAKHTVALPYDVLCVVAGFISSHRDLLAFCMANRNAYDAGIPFLYRDVFFQSWPDLRPEEAIPSGGWYRVDGSTEALMALLYRDLQQQSSGQARANHIRSLRHITVSKEGERGNDRTRDMPKNQLVYLVETLRQLRKLSVSVDDLVTPALESAISVSAITDLHLTPHRILAQSCPSVRLAQDSQTFLPLWGNIASPILKSLTITDLPPSSRTHLDRFTIPGSVEIWNIINHCPSLQHLDIRVKITGRGSGHNHINDITRRGPAASASAADRITLSQPVVNLRTLRLQNCTVAGFEFNRLGPESMEQLHIPYNGRKRLFRDLVNSPTASLHNMAFPRNLKSLVVDTLPLTPDRREPWQGAFDRCFAQLQLEELIVLTRKVDFLLQTAMGTAGSATWNTYGDDVSLNTRSVAVEMITGQKPKSTRHESGSDTVATSTAATTDASTAAATADGGSDSAAGDGAAPGVGTSIQNSLGMGNWLKRLLLKGSWLMTQGLVEALFTTCWGLEELGIALLWRNWDHNLSNFPPYIKRLRHLRALIILNEPQSKNMNAEWGGPLPTKNKIWGMRMDLEDDAFLQHGQPQGRLRYWGVGKKM